MQRGVLGVVAAADEVRVDSPLCVGEGEGGVGWACGVGDGLGFGGCGCGRR